MIRISEPVFGAPARDRVLAVLESGQLSQGPMVAEFERACAAMAGTEHAVAVTNGTVSLELALQALEIGPGDEVITSAFTFGATLNAILRSGATARFADITPDFTIDPASIADRITPKTRLLLPVHLYGLPADMDEITRLGHDRDLPILEDAAQAHGAAIGDRKVGSFGTGSFSFYATKNVAAGEGGVLTTNDEWLAARLRVLRNQGMEARYQYVAVGTNARMSDLHAAVALPEMEALEANNARRAANAERLSSKLDGIDGLRLPYTPADRRHVWHQYTVLLPPGADRLEVQRLLEQKGVQSGIYYPGVVWNSAAHRDHPGVVQDPTPRALDAAARVLSLPVHPRLSSEDVDQVAMALRSALGAPALPEAPARVLEHEA